MEQDKCEEYYAMMLNDLAGMEDDLGANQAPREAIELIREVLQICRDDFRTKFKGSIE